MSNFKSYIYCFIFILFVNCDELIEVEDISNRKLILLAPVDGSEINDSGLSINWEELEGAESYRIQIFKPSFEDATQMVVDSTSTATEVRAELEAGDFEVRLWAINSAYQSLYTFSKFTLNP